MHDNNFLSQSLGMVCKEWGYDPKLYLEINLICKFLWFKKEFDA